MNSENSENSDSVREKDDPSLGKACHDRDLGEILFELLGVRVEILGSLSKGDLEVTDDGTLLEKLSPGGYRKLPFIYE